MSGPGSGIEISDECISEYKSFQQSADSGKRCIIYKITDDNKQIVIEKKVDKGPGKDDAEDFDEIVSCLEDKEPRYLVFDLKGPGKGGAAANNRVIVLTWISDSAPVKKRMLYSASFNSLKAKLPGVYKFITVNDKGELTYQRIMSELS
ncbi:hypothetical protein BaRGS_00039001 [Batillaria attramentaria]|uniref:ADF-H domain-containing protein n=1 Tax=Batillaria attramentaria TaxID=370345 RepID=A0ABD0J4I1_9CAEN|nr:hypothetical protein BaRGS_017703 [Batillaria attramentaria]